MTDDKTGRPLYPMIWGEAPEKIKHGHRLEYSGTTELEEIFPDGPPLYFLAALTALARPGKHEHGYPREWWEHVLEARRFAPGLKDWHMIPPHPVRRGLPSPNPQTWERSADGGKTFEPAPNDAALPRAVWAGYSAFLLDALNGEKPAAARQRIQAEFDAFRAWRECQADGRTAENKAREDAQREASADAWMREARWPLALAVWCVAFGDAKQAAKAFDAPGEYGRRLEAVDIPGTLDAFAQCGRAIVHRDPIEALELALCSGAVRGFADDESGNPQPIPAETWQARRVKRRTTQAPGDSEPADIGAGLPGLLLDRQGVEKLAGCDKQIAQTGPAPPLPALPRGRKAEKAEPIKAALEALRQRIGDAAFAAGLSSVCAEEELRAVYPRRKDVPERTVSPHYRAALERIGAASR